MDNKDALKGAKGVIYGFRIFIGFNVWGLGFRGTWWVRDLTSRLQARITRGTVWLIGVINVLTKSSRPSK